MKRLLAALFIAPLILIAILIGLTGTQPGTRLIFDLAQTLHPPLKIGSVTGTLLGELTLDDLSYQNDGLSFDTTRLRLDWHPRTLWRGTFAIEDLTLEHPVVRLSPQENETGPVTLPEIHLPLEITIQSLNVHQLEIIQPDENHITVDQIALAATLKKDHLDVHELALSMARLRASGKGAIAFHHHWPLSVEIAWRYEEKTKWQGKGQASGDLQSLTLSHTLEAPFHLSTTASLDHLLANLSFNVKGEWEAIGWPLNDKMEWLSRQGHFRVHGHPSAYQFEMLTQVSGPRLPPNQLKIVGRGDSQGMVVTPLTLAGPVGNLEIHGHFHWIPELHWDFALRGREIDPGKFQPDWPGLLSLQVHTSGTLTPKLRLALELQQMEGRLRGHFLKASGTFHYHENLLKADQLTLQWAGNRFTLHGQGNNRHLDLEFDLDAPHLERLDPKLTGTLKGGGKLFGPPRQPTLDLTLNGDKIGWGRRVEIDHLSCQAKGGPNDPASQLRLQIHHLKFESWSFNEALLTGEGQLANHRFHIGARGPLGKISLHLQGGMDASGESHWQGDIQHLPLALSGPLLPEGVTAAGHVLAHFSYFQKGGRREGELKWNLQGGRFSASTPEGRPHAIEIAEGGGTLSLEDQTVRLAFSLPFAGHGQLGGRLTTDLDTQRLEGQANLDFTRLELIELFVPALHQIQGTAKGEIHLSGDWEHPGIQADFSLADLSAEIPGAGIRLEEGRFNAVTRLNGSIGLSGHLRSGEGALEMTGRIDLVPETKAAVKLHGKRFLVADLPQARVLLSPELTIVADSKRVGVKGKVHIPEAGINIKSSLLPDQQPGMVAVSPDEVIIGRPAKEVKKPPVDIAADILLTLGDQVFFNGFGIESQLQGELRLTSWKGLPKAEGVIGIVKGKFAAYGQKLNIKSGRLVFSGPVDNPGLDIEVARHFRRERMTINLRIGGFAKEPVIKITSDPSMPEDEALAYLIAGRSFRNKSSATSGSMEKQLTNALSSLGVNYLKDLGVGKYAELEFEEGFMYVGKYLTPDLYVGYAVDVFDGLGEAVVRYRLTERLTLEGRYGESQSGDLFYTLETD